MDGRLSIGAPTTKVSSGRYLLSVKQSDRRHKVNKLNATWSDHILNNKTNFFVVLGTIYIQAKNVLFTLYLAVWLDCQSDLFTHSKL